MNAYQHSSAIKKLRPIHQRCGAVYVAFLDVDNTWSGTPQEQQTVRDLLERRDYLVIPVTNRGSELCLSSKANPDKKAALQGLLDCDIVAASLGTELLVKQVPGGYRADEEYHRGLPIVQTWQKKLQRLVRRYTPAYSFITHYLDIPVLRVELIFNQLSAALRFREELLRDSAASSLHITRDKQTIILTPAHFSKEDAVQRILKALGRMVPAATRDFHLLFAGDSVSDLAMGLAAGPGTHATFLIPGGASLAREWRQTISEKVSVVSQGVYWLPSVHRYVVIGDEAFAGTAGPQTLIAWLNKGQH